MQQRLYFLRRLRSFGLTTQIMLTFYRAAIESVLTFSITVWCGFITAKEKLRMNSVVKTGSRIIGRDLPSFISLYQQRLLGKAITYRMIYSSLPMTYLIPFHLVASSDPSNPGPTGLVAAFSPSCTSPVKRNRSDFSPICSADTLQFQCDFIVYILTQFIIHYFIPHFIFILDHINYHLSMF